MTARSTCPLDCPDRCSLEVEVLESGKAEGRIVSLDGDRRNPWTDGYICGKVRRFPERVYGPDRVLWPSVRVGPRGPCAAEERTTRWRRVTWDEAIARVADRFRAIVSTDGAEAILPFWYGGSNGLLTGGAMDQRFWNRLGASRIVRTLCAANTGAATRKTYPGLGSAALDDVEHASLVVLWGVNPSASGIHLVPPLKRLRERGGKLIVVDPRRTPLARQADLHLPVLPGSDVAVAMAIAGVAFAGGFADRAFLERWAAADAPEFEAAAREWTPERAGEIAGIDPDLVRAFARMYAAASPAFLRCGWGPERNRNGTDSVRAVLALPAVFGKFGVRGGGYAMSTSPGYRQDLSAVQGSVSSPAPRQFNQSELGRILDETRDPPIRALYVYDCNPVATVPDQARIVRALARDEVFVVVHEQVWTDTADYADVVLPATTFLEHKELSRSYGSYVLQWSEPAIPPVGEARPNHAVFQALAHSMGWEEQAFGESEEDLARAVVRGTGAVAGDPGEAWASLQRDGVLALPQPVQFVPAGGEREGGRSPPLAGDAYPTGPMSLLPVPRWRPPPADALLPLVLISPASAKAITSTGFESVRGLACLEIHPDDAEPRGIAQGDLVSIRNSLGLVIVPAALSADVRRGVVSLPKGLWRRHTRNGMTATALAPAHTDEIGGGACYNDARVEVVRAP